MGHRYRVIIFPYIGHKLNATAIVKANRFNSPEAAIAVTNNTINVKPNDSPADQVLVLWPAHSFTSFFA